MIAALQSSNTFKCSAYKDHVKKQTSFVINANINCTKTYIAELRRKAEDHNYRNRITCVHRNTKWIAAWIAHGHTPANTKSYSLGLQRKSLKLDIHVMVN